MLPEIARKNKIEVDNRPYPVIEAGEEKCHLVGHDWGTLTSYMVANQRPDLL